MANFCEIYGYISYRGHEPDMRLLVDKVHADRRLKISFSATQKSFSLGYVSFAGEAKLDEDELEDWVRIIEAFVGSISFVVCTFHIVPDEFESRMYCYSSGERISKTITLQGGEVRNLVL